MNNAMKWEERMSDTHGFVPDPPVRVKDYRIGCIGAGMIMAECHLAAYRQAGFPVAAIASRTTAKAKAVAERWGIPTVHDTPPALIADPSYKLILLDELNIVLRYDYLPLDEVLEVLRNKPRDTHVIVTGRNAKDELIELADLVTEMTEIKHPFRAGVKAQAGIEF